MIAKTLLPSLGCLAILLMGCARGYKGELKDKDAVGRLTKKKNKLMKNGILAEVATAESKDLQTGINKVELECRGKLTRSVEAKTSTLQKQFKEEVGAEFLDHFTQVSKTVASTVLSGSTLLETPYREEKGKYEVHGIMVLDHKSFHDALASQLGANQAMFTRWQASKGYAELNKEAEAFEKFKKEMAGPPSSGDESTQPAEPSDDKSD